MRTKSLRRLGPIVGTALVLGGGATIAHASPAKEVRLIGPYPSKEECMVSHAWHSELPCFMSTGDHSVWAWYWDDGS